MPPSYDVGGSRRVVLSTRITGALIVLDRCDTEGMPTDIYFAGEGVRVKVDEDPRQVAEASRLPAASRFA
jgi:hypothetical protein